MHLCKWYEKRPTMVATPGALKLVCGAHAHLHSYAYAAYLRMDGRFYGWDFVAGTGVLCALILVRHRTNITRMLAGEESRSRMGFGGKHKDSKDD